MVKVSTLILSILLTLTTLVSIASVSEDIVLREKQKDLRNVIESLKSDIEGLRNTKDVRIPMIR